MSVELKPCPFCGGEAVIKWVGPGWMYKKYRERSVVVGCKSCKVATAYYWAATERDKQKAEQAAIKNWNRRPQE